MDSHVETARTNISSCMPISDASIVAMIASAGMVPWMATSAQSFVNGAHAAGWRRYTGLVVLVVDIFSKAEY